MVALVIFIPLFLVDNYKNKTNLKMLTFLLPSFLFWVGYWIYFKDRLVTGGAFYTLMHLRIGIPITFDGIYPFLLVYILGIIGLYILYSLNKKQFKLITVYISMIIIFSLFGFAGDFLRGFQFAALPLAILSGLTVQKGYEYLLNNYGKILAYGFLFILLFSSILGAIIFFTQLPVNQDGWNTSNTPFEEEYAHLKDYISNNTNQSDVIWAENSLTEKVAWMTGRKISNGRYPDGEYGATKGYVEKHQNINIYEQNKTILVNDINNKTLIRIKMII
jgi:hypothetical protein